MLKIGTRGSPLALAQAYETRDRLVAAGRIPAVDAAQLVVIKTTGDRVQDRALAAIGGKGLFTKEIEEQLLDGRIDLAVHSMKDMPTVLPEGLAIVGMLPREDPRDGWLSRDQRMLDQLPAGAVVGTSSLRRKAQVLSQRPDLQVIEFRGNVQTRMKKLADGVADATLLAAAGLNRLGMAHVQTAVFEPEQFLPAVAQGAIGIECRVDDAETIASVRAIGCRETEALVAAERAMLAELDGSCRTPIAGLCVRENDGLLWLRAMVATSDGKQVWWAEARGREPVSVGREAASSLRAQAGHLPWQMSDGT